ncbi:unnamed protein product [Paramecium primaurelia]|uniref:Uncharacterized protein n=1 Tax=Paramecium primaurelia TaxID=5886 RepID=A0A8S1Q4K7_PARPR|nr:unnamed protein product [Paramecium primaurelia]
MLEEKWVSLQINSQAQLWFFKKSRFRKVTQYCIDLLSYINDEFKQFMLMKPLLLINLAIQNVGNKKRIKNFENQSLFKNLLMQWWEQVKMAFRCFRYAQEMLIYLFLGNLQKSQSKVQLNFTKIKNSLLLWITVQLIKVR